MRRIYHLFNTGVGESRHLQESALVVGLSRAVTLCVVEKYRVACQATTGGNWTSTCQGRQGERYEPP